MAEPQSQKPAGRAAGKPRQQATEATAAVVREKGAHGEDVTMNGPLYKRKSANVVLVRRQRRKDEGAFRLLATLFVENQIGESCSPCLYLTAIEASPVLPRRQYGLRDKHSEEPKPTARPLLYTAG